jgi:hypothetical protein
MQGKMYTLLHSIAIYIDNQRVRANNNLIFFGE